METIDSIPPLAPAPTPSGGRDAGRKAAASDVNGVVGSLLGRMAQGDETALLLLYAQIAGTVHACSIRILKDAEEANDATSEIFFRLWNRADRYDPSRCSAMAWVLTVARRMALDRRRSLQRRARAMERMARELSAGEIAPETPSRMDLVQALDKLSAKDRALLESAYFEGLSGSEIARRDKLPLGTVKTRIRAALGRLRLAFHGGRS